MALEPNENPQSSINRFESMLKTDSIYFFDAEDFEDIIHHYLNFGKMALAKKAIRLGLKQHPNCFEIALLQVEVMVFEDRFAEAEKLLDELQHQNPSDEEIYIQRANILSKQENHKAAVKMLLEALHRTDDRFDIHSLLGMEYLFMDDYEQAKQNFIKCIEYEQSDYASLYNVIHCFEFLEDYDGGIQYLNDYLERNPYSEVAWQLLGKMYVELDLLQEALGAFEFAVISDDRFIGAYFEKAKVLEKMGRYNEAIENYEMTLKIDDPTSYAYLRLGKCHEKLGNFDLAKQYYYKTVHEDPMLDKGWLTITKFYCRQGNLKKALHYLNKAIGIDGENPQYWKESAKIYVALDKLDEADFAFKQAVAHGNYELDTWKDWAMVLYKINECHAAVDILLQGLEFYDHEATLLYQLSGLYMKLGDNDLAQKTMGRALQEDPQMASVFLALYPEFSTISWVRELISPNKKAST